MVKKILLPITFSIISSFLIGPIGFISGFKFGSIILSSVSLTIISSFSYYKLNKKKIIKINEEWKNKYIQYINENKINNTNYLNNFNKLDDYFFLFFLYKRKNKSLYKPDIDIILDTKLYIKYLNIFTLNEIPLTIEKTVFNKCYYLVYLNINYLCEKNNLDFYNKLIKLKNYDFKFIISNNYNFQQIYDTINNLKYNINISDKINSIHYIFNIITNIYPNIISDDLISLLSILIVNSENKYILTEIEFINFFYDESSHDKIGSKEYAFISFLSAIENIKNINL